MASTRRVVLCTLAAAIACLVAWRPAWGDEPWAPLTATAAVRLTPLPGADGATLGEFRLSRDGTRVLVFTPATPSRPLVLDTRTGARLFADEPPLAPTRPQTVLLSPDGGSLVYTEDGRTQRVIRVRDLATLDDRALVSGSPSLSLHGTSDLARVTAVFEPDAIRSPQPFGAEVVGQPRVTFGNPCPVRPGVTGVGPPASLSADGRYLAYVSYSVFPFDPTDPSRPRLVRGDVSNGIADCLPEPAAALRLAPFGSRLAISGDGRWIGYTGGGQFGGPARTAAITDSKTGTTTPVARGLATSEFLALSDDGRFVLITGRDSEISESHLVLVDRVTGRDITVLAPNGLPLDAGTLLGASLSGDGRAIVADVSTGASTGEAISSLYVARLDQDGDGLHDWWETAFGLDPSAPADASADPDADGRTNVEEFAAGTHPLGTPVRYFAEGAHGTFFATSLALFNPADTNVVANVRFLGPDGVDTSAPVPLAAHGSALVDAETLRLPFTEFSMIVESPVPLVAERRMTWDRASQYGSHAGTGVAAPSRTWYFAEGATIAGLQTFFLLQNPGDRPATVRIRYMLSTAVTEQRQHVVPARSRLTVWANQEGAPLDAAEFATTIMSEEPLVVERAMYRDAPGERFAAGSVTSGVASPALLWGFVEGATGAFFDTYLLLANPHDSSVDVGVQYILPTPASDVYVGAPPDIITRRYVLAPRSRRTIWVAREDPRLADTAVSMTVGASAAIVAERTMWWPGPTSATWRENHTDATSESAGLRWAVADIQADAQTGGWDTFLLINSPGPVGPLVFVDAACDDGTRVSKSYLLPPYRVTLWLRYDLPEIVGKRCGALIASSPRRLTLSPLVPPVQPPIQVEKAMYRGDFAAGSVSMATRLPDPP